MLFFNEDGGVAGMGDGSGVNVGVECGDNPPRADFTDESLSTLRWQPEQAASGGVETGAERIQKPIPIWVREVDSSLTYTT